MTVEVRGALRALDRVRRSQRARRDDAGDTLIEVLVALVVVGLCGLALLLTFTTSITASVEHRNLATLDTVLRSASESATLQIQQQSNALFTSCASASFYNSNVTLSAPSGYSVAITSVQYWTGTSFTPIGASCPSASLQPQLLSVTATASNGVSDSISFVVDDPLYALANTARPRLGAALIQWLVRGARRGAARSIRAFTSVGANAVTPSWIRVVRA